MHNWEYRILARKKHRAFDLFGTLNELGSTGWELVMETTDSTGNKLLMIFKRPLYDEKSRGQGDGRDAGLV